MNLFTELRIFHSQLTKNHPVIKEGVRWSERPVKLMAFETPLECSHWIRIYLSRATSKKKKRRKLAGKLFFFFFSRREAFSPASQKITFLPKLCKKSKNFYGFVLDGKQLIFKFLVL